MPVRRADHTHSDGVVVALHTPQQWPSSTTNRIPDVYQTAACFQEARSPIAPAVRRSGLCQLIRNMVGSTATLPPVVGTK